MLKFLAVIQKGAYQKRWTSKSAFTWTLPSQYCKYIYDTTWYRYSVIRSLSRIITSTTCMISKRWNLLSTHLGRHITRLPVVKVDVIHCSWRYTILDTNARLVNNWSFLLNARISKYTKTTGSWRHRPTMAIVMPAVIRRSPYTDEGFVAA